MFFYFFLIRFSLVLTNITTITATFFSSLNRKGNLDLAKELLTYSLVKTPECIRSGCTALLHFKQMRAFQTFLQVT